MVHHFYSPFFLLMLMKIKSYKFLCRKWIVYRFTLEDRISVFTVVICENNEIHANANFRR